MILVEASYVEFYLNSRLAENALLTQSAISAIFDKENNKSFKKTIKRLQND